MFNFDAAHVTFDSSVYEFTGMPLGGRAPGCREDLDELTAQALALLPRGRAWQTDEIGPRPGSVLYGYWRSVADVFRFAASRLCDLHPEFFCATRRETDAEWMEEYGLPDECDPFPDLCTKVAARGGPYCDVYQDIAARAGWDIDCIFDPDSCGALAGGMLAGCDWVGGSSPPALIRIMVYPESSPAFAGRLEAGPFAGCFQTGYLLDCEPDISGLICILSRIVHAHNEIEYLISAEPRGGV